MRNDPDRNNPVYYVYILLDPRKGDEPFYVGKGKRKRIIETIKPNGQNPFKDKIIRKIEAAGFKPKHEIVAEGLLEEDAFALEISLIAKYGRRDQQLGTLANLTDGGEGLAGWVMPHEKRERLRADNPGGKKNSKPIHQICTVTGQVLATWPSARSAARDTGAKPANITANAKDLNRGTAAGYMWRWVGSNEVQDGKIDISAYDFSKTKLLYQIDPTTLKVVKVWASHKEACTAFGTYSFSDSYKDGSSRRLYGYHWRNEDTNDIIDGELKLPPEFSKFAISQKQMDGSNIRVWRSAKEAAKHYGVCNSSLGKAAKAGLPFAGYFWERLSKS